MASRKSEEPDGQMGGQTDGQGETFNAAPRERHIMRFIGSEWSLTLLAFNSIHKDEMFLFSLSSHDADDLSQILSVLKVNSDCHCLHHAITSAVTCERAATKLLALSTCCLRLDCIVLLVYWLIHDTSSRHQFSEKVMSMIRTIWCLLLGFIIRY